MSLGPMAAGATIGLEAPFPWFGGKRRCAAEVWARFGDVTNYVEAFFGSGAVLLGRPPPWSGSETVNDLDGYVCNFWRAVRAAPEVVAEYADWPVNENDLHARHAWLVGRRSTLVACLEGDPGWFDARIAGWWVWGLSCWIGSGFASGTGPWHVVDGRLVKQAGDAGRGVTRKLPHLGDAGRGVNRQRALCSWFQSLADRLRGVRVCCGDWSRVCGPSVTRRHGLTGVFLDPPYGADTGRDPSLYRVDSLDVASDVRVWALEVGARPDVRVALCGYEGEHDMPGWTGYRWKAQGGYGGQSEEHDNPNAARERIWFSPACLSSRQGLLPW